MGVRVAHDRRNEIAVLYCSTSGTAFGPIFEGSEADTEAEDFLTWLRENEETVSWAVAVARDGDGTDPRHYDAGELERIVNHWRSLQTYVGDDR